MKLKNKKIKEIKNWQKYKIYIPLIEPSNKLEYDEANFIDLLFDEVSVLKRYFTKSDKTSMQIVIDVFFDCVNIDDVRIFDYIAFLNWLSLNMKKLYEREKQLSNNTVIKGSDKLNVLGDENTKINLGEQFGIRPKEISKWKYTEVYNIMLRNKLKADIVELNKKK